MTFTEYLGIIARTHGLDGTVILSELSGILPSLVPGDVVGIGYSREYTEPLTIVDADIAPQRIALRFAGITSSEMAEALVDRAVYLAEETAGTKDKDRYSIGEIEGCTVVTVDGTMLGKVIDVWLLPANDVWVVEAEGGGTIPLPVIEDVVKHVDLAARSITVELLDGLADINRTTAEDDSDE